jgi:hypothetical protein
VVGFERRLVADVRQLEPVNLPLAEVTFLICCFGLWLFPVASAVYRARNEAWSLFVTTITWHRHSIHFV